jgi:hypothetical protein
MLNKHEKYADDTIYDYSCDKNVHSNRYLYVLYSVWSLKHHSP